MVLRRLHLQNFKRYSEFTLAFTEGLTGIIGRNGSGKSTLFEAIYFALYGEVKKENVRHSGADAKAPVIVELWFETDGNGYRVERSFRGRALAAQAKLFCAEELIATGVTEVNNTIAGLTGMSKEAFSHTLFASQKELMSLGSLKNEERRKIIRKLLGLERIDRVEKILIEEIREKRRDIKSYAAVLMDEAGREEKKREIERLEVRLRSQSAALQKERKGIDDLQEREESAKKELLHYQRQREKKLEREHAYKIVLQKLQGIKKRLEDLRSEERELEKLAKEYASLEKTKEIYEELQKTLTKMRKLELLQKEKEGLERETRQLRIRYREKKEEIAALQKALLPMERTREEKKRWQDSLEKIETQMARLQREERRLRDIIAGEKRQIADTRKQIERIERLGRESPCPTCTRPLLDAYDEVISSLRGKITALYQKEIERTEEKLGLSVQKMERLASERERLGQHLEEAGQKMVLMEQKEREFARAKRDLHDLEREGKEAKEALEALRDLDYDKMAHQALLDREKALKSEYEKAVRLETKLERIKKVRLAISENEKKLAALEEEVHKREAEYRSFPYDETLHQQMRETLAALERKRREQTEVLQTLSVQITETEGEIKRLRSLLEADAQKRERLGILERDLHDDEKIRLSLDAFKTSLNSRVAPRISMIASELFAMITRGRYQHIEVSNDFDFFIYDEGVRYPIGRFSGGEVDLANLVLRIAISRTLGELNGATSVGFLAFDEIFGSQDHERRMMIMEALHLIKEQYRQIFLISHEGEIKEMLEHVVELH